MLVGARGLPEMVQELSVLLPAGRTKNWTPLATGPIHHIGSKTHMQSVVKEQMGTKPTMAPSLHIPDLNCKWKNPFL
jgi:hypothetical protein